MNSLPAALVEAIERSGVPLQAVPLAPLEGGFIRPAKAALTRWETAPPVTRVGHSDVGLVLEVEGQPGEVDLDVRVEAARTRAADPVNPEAGAPIGRWDLVPGASWAVEAAGLHAIQAPVDLFPDRGLVNLRVSWHGRAAGFRVLMVEPSTSTADFGVRAAVSHQPHARQEN